MITSTEGENDSNFNFEEWVNDNELSEIKQLLIKHKVTTKSALSFNSAQFQSLMSDPELYKTPHMIPIVTNAIKNDDSYIIVSEEEHIVMDSIKKNLKKLQQIEEEINALKQTYPKSAQTKQNIILSHTEKTKQKINNIFNNINKVVENKRNALLNELMNVTSDLNDQNNEAKDDDNKEMDMISNLTQKIQTENEYLNNKLKMCKSMIKKTKSNDDRTKRKQCMNKIGDEAKNKFDKTERELTENAKFMKNIIYNNNNYKINIDFKFNEKKYQKILKIVNDFGIISKDNIIMEDGDEIIIKQMKSELIKAQQEITTSKQTINSLKTASNQKQTINNLENNVSRKDQQITQAQQEITTLKQEINSLETVSNQQQTRINSLENKIVQKDQQIAQNFALLNEALTYKSNIYGWDYEAKEGGKPVLYVSKNPDVVRLLNGEYQFSMNVKKNPKIKSIEEICKCIMVLWKGTADSLSNGAIKCGYTYCLCGPNKTIEGKIVGFKRCQQGIGVETEHKVLGWGGFWARSANNNNDDVKHETLSLSAVKVMNETQYKIYKLEKDKKYWKKRYESTQK